jgi:hypothetical protein
MIRRYERGLEAAALAMVALVLTGCASTPEEPSSEPFVLTAGQSAVFYPDGTAKVFRSREEREAYDASQAQEQVKAADELSELELSELREKRYEWLRMKESQPYLDWLCAMSLDSREYREEIFRAAGKFGFVPKRDPNSDAMAETRGLAVLDCAARASSQATE